MTDTRSHIDLRQPSLPRRIAPAVGLFFLAPVVGEYLLGNVPVGQLPALPILALMYGGGARCWSASSRAAPAAAGPQCSCWPSPTAYLKRG